MKRYHTYIKFIKMTARIIFACDKIINTNRYFVLKSIQVLNK